MMTLNRHELVAKRISSDFPLMEWAFCMKKVSFVGRVVLFCVDVDFIVDGLFIVALLLL